MTARRKDAKNPVITHGLYADLAKRRIDGRTKVGKALTEARYGLAALFPGGETNAAAAILIDRIAYKTLKLAMYEAQDLKGMEGVTASSEGKYLSMSNSLREDIRLLMALAQKQAPEAAPSLEDYLAGLKESGKLIETEKVEK